jgi:hypothetical protein
MSEFSRVRGRCGLGALLVIASALAVGCSSAGPGEEGSLPEVKDQGISTQSTTRSDIIELIPATPIPQYCSVPGIVPLNLPAHWVEKIPNNWGVGYTSTPNPWTGVAGNSRFSDGYSIPFPTPWINPGTTTPDPHTYEMSLWWIPSTLWWEYLVHDIQGPPPGSRLYSEDLSRAFFMVPIPSLSDYTAASSLAAANTAYPVEARANKCVRVLTRSGSYIYDTGESFFVYDEHDPQSPPN